MERKVKLIWDFKGQGASTIAEKHATHLKEYITIKKLPITIVGFEHFSELYSIAYMVVTEGEIKSIRDILKPHRGELYE